LRSSERQREFGRCGTLEYGVEFLV